MEPNSLLLIQYLANMKKKKSTALFYNRSAITSCTTNPTLQKKGGKEEQLSTMAGMLNLQLAGQIQPTEPPYPAHRAPNRSGNLVVGKQWPLIWPTSALPNSQTPSPAWPGRAMPCLPTPPSPPMMPGHVPFPLPCGTGLEAGHTHFPPSGARPCPSSPCKSLAIFLFLAELSLSSFPCLAAFSPSLPFLPSPSVPADR